MNEDRPNIKSYPIKQVLNMSIEELENFLNRVLQTSIIGRKNKNLLYTKFIRKRKTQGQIDLPKKQENGKLTAILELKRKDKDDKKVYLLCFCECGCYCIARTDNFKKGIGQGGISSCGCWNREVYTNLFNSQETIEKRTQTLMNNLEQQGRIIHVGDIIEGWKITASEFQRRDENSKKERRRYVKGICPFCKKESDWIRADGILSHHALSCGCLQNAELSYGAKRVLEILENANKKVIREKQFEDCRFPETNLKARFDFWVEETYLIEYDGEQHFKRGFNSSAEELRKLQQRDKFKNDWALSHNIPLIRIPYTLRDVVTIEDLVPETSKYLVRKER